MSDDDKPPLFGPPALTADEVSRDGRPLLGAMVKAIYDRIVLGKRSDRRNETQQGWQCPACGKGNAPHVDACRHCAVYALSPIPPITFLPTSDSNPYTVRIKPCVHEWRKYNDADGDHYYLCDLCGSFSFSVLHDENPV